MPALVPGYEYDIFISYRQKDNKYDGWVTDFVSNLKKELEATFKEDLSIYFDENPHDGINETHDVDESLKDKIRCLIFIPIVSQTYSDPNSFAWNNEFIAFRDFALSDSFGLKVKVANGNIASRILPVRIHDIDPDDLQRLENELHGRMRSIDFIYKSPGVNRPLRSFEESPHANLNHTIYRDQINKVANGLKELMASLTNSQSVSNKPDASRSLTYVFNGRKNLAFLVAIGLVLATISGFIIFWNRTGSQYPIDKTIAVLPFKTLSNDEEQKYFSYGVMEDIISKLYKVADMQVTSGTSAFRYQNTTKGAQEIGRELNVSYILEGSVRKSGETVRIAARLVQSSDDRSIWSETFEEDLEDIFEVQNEVAERIVNALEIKLSKRERELVVKSNTSSALAFEYYQQGRFYNELSGSDNLEKSKNFFQKAIETDSLYAAAYAGLAEVDISSIEWGYANPNEVSKFIYSNIEKAISLDSLLGEAYSALGAYHTYCTHNFVEAEEAFKNGIRLNPGYDFTYFHYSVLQVVLKNQKKALELSNLALKLNPLSVKTNVYVVQRDYYLFGDYDKGLQELERILEIFPNDNFALWVLGTVQTQKGNYPEAINAFLKRSIPSKHTNWALGYAYAKAGKTREAKEILSFLLEKEKQTYIMPTFIACIYLGLGEKEKGIEYLQKASQLNDYWTVFYGLDPWLDPVRSDPRFIQILQKAKLN